MIVKIMCIYVHVTKTKEKNNVFLQLRLVQIFNETLFTSDSISHEVIYLLL